MKAIKTAALAAGLTFVTIITGGAILSALGMAGAGTLGATLTASFALSSAIVTGVGTLIASGIGMLTSRGVQATKQNFGTKIATRDAKAPRQIVYGECRVGGTIVKITSSGDANYKLHIAVALAGHEIESLDAIYYNDELLTTSSGTVSGETVYTVTNSSLVNTENTNAFGSGGLIRYTFHDGSQTTVDGLANAAVPSDYPSTCKFQGIAYVYMELVYDPEKNGQLPNLWFQVKGKKVYDPRTSSTAYSNNPALIIRDYLTDTVYGLKAVSSEINDLDASGGFYASADVCDQLISTPTSSLTTYAVTVSGGKFYINGTQQQSLTLTEGNTYRFDQSSNTNSSHPLRLSTTSDGTHGGGSAYTTGVTVVGTAGSSGAYTQITVAASAPNLYYYCTNHSGMGGSAATSTGVQESRYTANGFSNASASGDGLLEGLLSSCSGSITYTNGEFNLFVGGDRTASLTITDDDVLGPISVSTRGNSGDLYNVVKSIFVDSTAKYEAMESPVYEDATFLAADTPSGESSANYKRILEMQLPFTSTNTMAQRLHTIGLIRQRQTASISILSTVEYLKLQPSDWVNVTNSRLGYSAKTFEVISTTLEFLENDGVIFAATRLNLQEIDDTVYDYDAANYLAPTSEGATPDGGSKAILAPQNAALAQINAQEGTTSKISVKVSWTNRDDDAIQGTEIQYRLSTDGANDYKAAGQAGKGISNVVFAGAVVGDQYYVRIRHFSFDNVVSGWTSPVNITIAQPDTITAPTSVSASTGKQGYIEIGFTSPAVDSVSSVNIYFSTSSGFTPAAGNLLTSLAVNKGNVRTHNVGLANGLNYATTYYFKLTALNNYDSESSASSEVSGSFTKVDTGDIVDGAIDVAKFASSIEPVTLVTSVPSSKTTEVIYNTTNNVLYRWNGSSYVAATGVTDFSQLSGNVTAAQFASTIQPVTLVTSVPSTKSTETIYNTTNNTLYRWDGSAYVTVQGATNFSQLAGTVQTSQIAAASVTAAKLGTAAVEAGKIAANAVTTDKIAALAVNADKIASNAITTAKIAADAITSSELADSAATEAVIAANAITATKISDGAVETAKLAAGSVTAAKITAGTITASEIASATIVAGNIATGTITASKIAANTITSTQIAAGAITATEILSGTITALQIATNAITASKIAANTITAAEIAVGAISATEIAAGAVTTAKLGALAVNADKIAANTITAAKIATGTITAAEIASATITATQIASNTITAGQIAAGAISTSELAVGAVDTNNLADDAITAAKILDGSITATLIGNGQIVTAKLDANAVTAAKIQAGTITANEIATGTITANEISANTITAGQIAAGAITATEIAADSLSIGKLISNTSKQYGGSSNNDFQFEFGTNTSVAGFIGAGILRTGVASGFGVAGLANADNSVAVAGQQAYNGTNSYAGYYANSTILGGSVHRSQVGLCNNTRAILAADNASTQNIAYVCDGTYALRTTGDLYVDGDITATGTITPFTGMHDGLMADSATPEIGDILVDTEVLIKRNVSNTLFLMESCSSANQPTIGIYSGDRANDYVPVSAAASPIAPDRTITNWDHENSPELDPQYAPLFTNRKTVIVNSLGEGQVNVCGEGGDIAVGDLIATSSVSGKGMKQSDDIVRSHTVAKAREPVTFTDASDIRQIACIYLCG